MAWHIAVGFCVFGIGWYAVDQYVPDLLPRIDVAVMTAGKHISSAARSFAIESKNNKGDRSLKASPQSETIDSAEIQAESNDYGDSQGTRNESIEESQQSENLSMVKQALNDDEKDSKDIRSGGLVVSLQPETVGEAEKWAVDSEYRHGEGTRQISIEDSQQSQNSSAVVQVLKDDEKGDKGSGETGQETRPYPKTKEAYPKTKENQGTKDTRDAALYGRPQREIFDAVELKGNGGMAGDPGFTIPFRSEENVAHSRTKPFQPVHNTAVGHGKSMQSFLYEKLVEILVPNDLRIIYRAVRRAWQRMDWPQWIADEDWDNAHLLLLSSLLWIGIATLYFRGGTESRKKEIDASPESPACETPAGAESSLLVREMARHALQACRHEGGYIYSKGSNQLRKEDAAAATIQRWSRTKLKRWLREHALSRPSIETSPTNSQRWIDDDHGAVVTTVLKDRDVSVDALGPPEGELHSRNKAALEKSLFELGRRGGAHVDSRRHTRHRQKFSLTSKKISDSLLSLESHANSHASYSPASKPP